MDSFLAFFNNTAQDALHNPC